MIRAAHPAPRPLAARLRHGLSMLHVSAWKALAAGVLRRTHHHLERLDRARFDADVAAGFPALDQHAQCWEYPADACDLCRTQKAQQVLAGDTHEEDPERW